MDKQYINELIENVTHCLQVFEGTLKYYNKKGQFSGILKKVKGALNSIKNVSEELEADTEVFAGLVEAENIEDWKDIAIKMLPDGASLGMANDVEAALDQFKSVY